MPPVAKGQKHKVAPANQQNETVKFAVDPADTEITIEVDAGDRDVTCVINGIEQVMDVTRTFQILAGSDEVAGVFKNRAANGRHRVDIRPR